MLSTADAAFTMGPGDPSGRFCSLVYVGAPLSSRYYAIPWNLNTSTATMVALDSLAVAAVSFGDYQAGVSADNFPSDRTQACQAFDSAVSAQLSADLLSPLSFKQLAGIFFVVVMGIGMAAFSYGFFHAVQARHLRHLPLHLRHHVVRTKNFPCPLLFPFSLSLACAESSASWRAWRRGAGAPRR